MGNEQKYDLVRHDDVKMSTGRKIRFYELDDEINKDNMKVPSVTTILGLIDNFKDWKEKEKYAFEIMLYAQIVGCLGHWRVQNELSKAWGLGYVDLELNSIQKYHYTQWIEDFPYSEKENGVRSAMEKIVNFYKDWFETFQPIHPYVEKTVRGKTIKDEIPLNPFEYPILSKKYGYAGSIDILASIKIEKRKGSKKIPKRLPICIVDIKTTKNFKQDYKLQCAGYEMGFLEMHPEYTIDDVRILYLPKNTIDWDYSFPKFRKGLEVYRIKWLEKVAEFYMVYGDEEPVCFYKEDILSNIEKYGIELSELEIRSKEDYFYKSGHTGMDVKDKSRFLSGIS
jgi:hypothetical protein